MMRGTGPIEALGEVSILRTGGEEIFVYNILPTLVKVESL
jgi:hypothetical protein